MTWLLLFGEWDAIASDLQEIYGINVWDQAQMRSGSWLELRARILSLLRRPITHDPFGNPVCTSMLQHRLLAPSKPA